jgi:hypothetical protein
MKMSQRIKNSVRVQEEKNKSLTPDILIKNVLMEIKEKIENDIKNITVRNNVFDYPNKIRKVELWIK